MGHRERRRREDRRLTWLAGAVTAGLCFLFTLGGCSSSPDTMAVRHAEVWCTYHGWVGNELETCMRVVSETFRSLEDGTEG